MQSQQLLASCVTTLAQRGQRATKVRTRFRELELPTRPVRLDGGTTRRTLLPFPRAQVRDGAFVALKALYLEDETTPQAAPPPALCWLPPATPTARLPSRPAATPPLRHSAFLPALTSHCRHPRCPPSSICPRRAGWRATGGRDPCRARAELALMEACGRDDELGAAASAATKRRGRATDSKRATTGRHHGGSGAFSAVGCAGARR